MDLDQLRTFIEVVRQGSFAGAARFLNLEPSKVTRAVAALEAELGVRLLQRTTRQLSLTEGGESYLAQVSPLLTELDLAAEELRAGSGQLRGLVRITASVAFGQTVLVPLLPELHRRHPGLELDLMLTDAVVDLVSQRVDIALRLGPAVNSSLVGQRQRDVRFRVVASPAYLKRHGRPRQPVDLADCSCLRFPLPGFRALWRFRSASGGQVEEVPIQGWLVASTALALRQAALDGLGPALLADWLIDKDLLAGRLVDLFPDLEATATDFDSAVWLLYAAREKQLPKRVQSVLALLREHLSR
ncbi:LysR family transcriptional regulator [Piscinibacter gummiphilus]|uniref:LysR family transcriptional regulator n=1 Tax=Piscinibacter gummiphilus TaxID=946333 RepID=A0A1W6LDD8_9BURK|nr:LysR family transcriptional regulator [Piscinibacter gummiphilus]ARN22188.1 LysR family transcriptional regulator [Piscinibacter gummiphilus]ATU66877.1 LysR family transcriptional regulator [Piscinibacter gummiphilus]GLS94286.1 LysR family transcriptional regulator [Piscinibacter gummiphilus]